jgi:NAD+ kinase
MDTIKKVGILYHPLIAPAAVLAQELANFLAEQKIAAWVGSSWEEEKARAQMLGTELILSVGGDGTILRSAQSVIGTDIPIVGVNLGKLGFLTELSAGEAKNLLPEILNGKGWIDERNMLEVSLPLQREGQCRTFTALNDIVIARGAAVRVVNIEVTIDGTKFTDYTADGVITATATGSTGYSLAAGGPIMCPWSRDFLLIPILPHLNLPYTLVLPEKTEVGFRISTPYAATLSIDGHTNLPLSGGSTVVVKESTYKTKFLRIHPKASFYGTLEQKLKGKRNANSGPKSQNG